MVPFQESQAFCPEIVGDECQNDDYQMETYLLKQTIKIYVDNISSIGVQENIFTMSITEPCACSAKQHYKENSGMSLPKDKPNH